jgi:hypothetical protein
MRERGAFAQTRAQSGTSFQDTLKTSLCAIRLFPTARMSWKDLPDTARVRSHAFPSQRMLLPLPPVNRI